MNKKNTKNKGNIISIGAEAVLYLNKKENKVVKDRTEKQYRIHAIDNKLRNSRTRREAKVLEKLAASGFTPQLLFTDNESVLELEYVAGKRLSECLEKEEWKKIGEQIGKNIKHLHNSGIIHGDITTSNMILKNTHGQSPNMFFIDFGLSFFSQKIEDMAVDLHVLEEALESRHHTISRRMFEIVKEAYGDNCVLKRLKEVEARGRNKNHK